MHSQRPSVEELFLEVVQKDPTERMAFLEAECADIKVRTRVQALLKAHDGAGTFLEGPAVQPARLAAKRYSDTSAVQIHGDAPPSKGLADDLTKFLAPPERPDEIGRLGPYRILAVLGQGGMGVVFRAHDPGLDRLVALKAMLPSMAAAPAATDRFLREAKAAAGLKHPHVVTIFQVGEDRGAPFLAMEFLEGEPLDGRIRRESRLPLAEVLRIGRETALGLAAAHVRGLVHRDIKPANLWLEGPAGHVKILDFGLARAQADQVDQAHLTQLGMIVGTPAYMAPEQAEGKPAHQRCDLFSLGCVLYEMATGTRPFHRENTIAVLRALALHEPPPVSELRPDAPRELAVLVARLLEKKPEDRPASAQEVAETLHALEQIEPHSTTQILPGPVAKPARRSRKPLVATACVALAIALALIPALWPPPRGTVRIESDDPAVEVVFDNNGPTIKGADQEPIALEAGAHGVLIKRGDFTFEADKLVLKKGAVLTLKVDVLQGKFHVVQNGQVVASQDMPLLPPPLAKAPFDARHARDHQKAWATYLGVPVVATNPLGMRFRLIPPGEFTMGVTEAEAEAWANFTEYSSDSRRAFPAHRVRLTRPFYLAESEIRYADFLDLMKREPGHDSKRDRFNVPDGVLLSRCTWIDCIEFCNRLSEQEGLTAAYQVDRQAVTVIANATGYRLPTEAEWEFACRAGTTSLWYFGLTAQKALAMCKKPDRGAGGLYLRARLADPNPFGLLGMYAGAAEWCWDWYDSGYYRECDERGMVADPQGPDSGMLRVIRGGTNFAGAGSDLTQINSAARNPQDPVKTAGINGFGRVVLPIPAKGKAGTAVPVRDR